MSDPVTADLEVMTRTLAEHFWSATDDETCKCGWKSSNWDDLRLRWEMAHCEEDDHTPQIDRAVREFTQHQAAVLASLPDDRLAEAAAMAEFHEAAARTAIAAGEKLQAKVERVRLLCVGRGTVTVGSIRAALSGGDA